ncbi:MAG: hypothetical protein OEY89_00395 [Gammaproteobacteria bacterium]|nr:hypothetical protein [Gammaproteobacteria bacterium]
MSIAITLFITAITLTLALPAVAEDSLPPSGPYKSINDTEQYNLPRDITRSPYHKNMDKPAVMQPGQYSYTDRVPEWVIKRQAEMQNMRMPFNGATNTGNGNQTFQQPEIPEWVKQRQAQIEQWHKQSNRPVQGWNNQQPPQWGQAYQPSMRNPNNAQLPPTNNRYYPPVPGPVYRQGTQPPVFNNHPGNNNAYPPVWR